MADPRVSAGCCGKPFCIWRALNSALRRKRRRLRGEKVFLAPRVGLEPTTLRLTAECSTIELPRSNAGGSFHHTKAISQTNDPSVNSLHRCWHRSDSYLSTYRVSLECCQDAQVASRFIQRCER